MRALYFEENLWKPREDTVALEHSGFRNFWAATDSLSGTHLRQTAGINPISPPTRHGRRPAVAIFLTPAGEKHRLPWFDEVDLDNGFIRYFGDNKPELRVPAEGSAGNRVLLDEMDNYASDDPARRLRAAPLLFFRNLGGPDGLPLTEFLGFGLVQRAHRVTQLHKGRSFTNYAFDCVLFRGLEDAEGREYLDIDWIDRRRDPETHDSDSTKGAPESWRRWVKNGTPSLGSPQVRRVVLRSDVWPKAEQVPPEDSPLGRTLRTIYEHFGGNYKHGFQALASLVTAQIVGDGGLGYHQGWVTPVGPDGGVDFVQRLDIGSGFSTARVVVLGQAKCKSPWSSNSGISAEELARVVARLRRGWIGSYVTTSYFTEDAQKELIADEYPLVLVDGKRLAQATEVRRDALGFKTIDALLEHVDSLYPQMLQAARTRPSDIMTELPGAHSAPI